MRFLAIQTPTYDYDAEQLFNLRYFVNEWKHSISGWLLKSKDIYTKWQVHFYNKHFMKDIVKSYNESEEEIGEEKSTDAAAYLVAATGTAPATQYYRPKKMTTMAWKVTTVWS
jgi:hypothetical protein